MEQKTEPKEGDPREQSKDQPKRFTFRSPLKALRISSSFQPIRKRTYEGLSHGSTTVTDTGRSYIEDFRQGGCERTKKTTRKSGPYHYRKTITIRLLRNRVGKNSPGSWDGVKTVTSSQFLTTRWT